MAGASISNIVNPGALTKKQMFGMSVGAGLTSGIIGNQANYAITKKRYDKTMANYRGRHTKHQPGPMPPQSGGGVLY